MNKYLYHSQRQAEEFAKQILTPPTDYTPREGLPPDYGVFFDRLCSLAKAIYSDMAAEPDAYGLMLLDIGEADHNLARDSYRTVHRFGDTLNALFINGEVGGHVLTVDSAKFKTGIKKKPAS